MRDVDKSLINSERLQLDGGFSLTGCTVIFYLGMCFFFRFIPNRDTNTCYQ